MMQQEISVCVLCRRNGICSLWRRQLDRMLDLQVRRYDESTAFPLISCFLEPNPGGKGRHCTADLQAG